MRRSALVASPGSGAPREQRCGHLGPMTTGGTTEAFADVRRSPERSGSGGCGQVGRKIAVPSRRTGFVAILSGREEARRDLASLSYFERGASIRGQGSSRSYLVRRPYCGPPGRCVIAITGVSVLTPPGARGPEQALEGARRGQADSARATQEVGEDIQLHGGRRTWAQTPEIAEAHGFLGVARRPLFDRDPHRRR